MVHVIFLQNEGVLKPDERRRARSTKGKTKDVLCFHTFSIFQMIATLIKASSGLTAEGKLLCSEPTQKIKLVPSIYCILLVFYLKALPRTGLSER